MRNLEYGGDHDDELEYLAVTKEVSVVVVEAAGNDQSVAVDGRASVTFSDRCEDVVPRQHQSKIYLYVYGNHCGSFQPDFASWAWARRDTSY